MGGMSNKNQLLTAAAIAAAGVATGGFGLLGAAATGAAEGAAATGGLMVAGETAGAAGAGMAAGEAAGAGLAASEAAAGMTAAETAAAGYGGAELAGAGGMGAAETAAGGSSLYAPTATEAAIDMGQMAGSNPYMATATEAAIDMGQMAGSNPYMATASEAAIDSGTMGASPYNWWDRTSYEAGRMMQGDFGGMSGMAGRMGTNAAMQIGQGLLAQPQQPVMSGGGPRTQSMAPSATNAEILAGGQGGFRPKPLSDTVFGYDPYFEDKEQRRRRGLLG